jgi:fucose permease
MAIALAGIALALGFTPVIASFPLLLVIMGLLGAAQGSLDVGGNTLLVWLHGSRVGAYMNGLHFFFGVGAFIAPLVLAQVSLATGRIQEGFWLMAVYMLPVALWLARLPSPAPRQEEHPVASQKTYWKSVVLVMAFLFVYVAIEASYGGWIYTYGILLTGLDAPAAAHLTALFWLTFTIGRLAAVPFARRMHPSRILLAALAVCLVSLAVMLFEPHSVGALFIGTGGLGAGLAAIFPTTFSLAERRIPLNGRITAWFMVGASGGGLSLPWLVGQLFDHYGAQVFLPVEAAALGVLWLVFVLMVKPAKTPSPL